jgi:hypothetical protein
MERRAFRTALSSWREWNAFLTRMRPLAEMLERPGPLEAPRVSPRESGAR